MRVAWFTDSLDCSLARAAELTLHWGLETVVLRGLDGGARVPYGNEGKVRNRLHAHGLHVAAVDPGLFEVPALSQASRLNELEVLAETSAFAHRMGCDTILCGASPGDGLPVAAEMLRRGVAEKVPEPLVLAVRNHAGRDSAGDLAELLRAAKHARVLACWDPAHAFSRAGEAPTDGIRALSDRLACVIVRDGLIERGNWVSAPLGEGQIGWPDLVATLADIGFSGSLCLEFEGASPIEALRDTTALLHMIRDAGI